MSDDVFHGGRSHSHATAAATALFVTVLWSSSWVLIRWGLDDADLEPITFAALRYGLASIVLLAAVASKPAMRSHLTNLDRESVRRVIVLGFVFYAVTQGAQFVAIDRQPTATTSLVLSWTPVLVGLASARALSERPSPRQYGGAVLVAGGAWLYFAGDLGATGVGMIAALVALAANATSSLLGRVVNRSGSTPAIVITATSMAVGAVALGVAGVAIEGMPHVSLRAWGIIAWLAVVNTALAFTLWNVSLTRLTALESSGINNTMLIQIALLSWLFLGEAPGTAALVGIAMVTMGIAMTQSR